MPCRDPETRRVRDRERARLRTAGRVEAGLCPRCGRHAPEPGRHLCADCGEKRRVADRARAAQRRTAGIGRVRDPKARQAEYARARQRDAARLARGLCTRCARHPHEPDRRLCAACAEQRRRAERARYARAKSAGRPYGGKDPQAKRRLARRRSRKRQRERRAAGLCIRCGACRPVEGGSSCGNCLRKRRAADRQTYAARRAAGLCGRCGTPTFEGAPLCGPCTVFEARHQPRKYAANRARYAERRARWVCTHCGRRPSYGASRCEPCAKRAWEQSEHVRGLPVYPPSFTVVERATDAEHGTFDTWEEVAIALAFAHLSLDDVHILIDQAPMQTTFIL